MLVEEFENFEVTGSEDYKIESDSLWVLAREFELPIWVITRYNPARSGHRAGRVDYYPGRPRQG